MSKEDTSPTPAEMQSYKEFFDEIISCPDSSPEIPPEMAADVPTATGGPTEQVPGTENSAEMWTLSVGAAMDRFSSLFWLSIKITSSQNVDQKASGPQTESSPTQPGLKSGFDPTLFDVPPPGTAAKALEYIEVGYPFDEPSQHQHRTHQMSGQIDSNMKPLHDTQSMIQKLTTEHDFQADLNPGQVTSGPIDMPAGQPGYSQTRPCRSSHPRFQFRKIAPKPA